MLQGLMTTAPSGCYLPAGLGLTPASPFMRGSGPAYTGWEPGAFTMAEAERAWYPDIGPWALGGTWISQHQRPWTGRRPGSWSPCVLLP